jgi:hypothetical protein
MLSEVLRQLLDGGAGLDSGLVAGLEDLRYKS